MAPKEERRIGVAMTAMLTIMAYRFMVAGLLPKITYMTRLDMFVLISTLLVFATLIEAVSCTVLIRREQITAARRLDKFSRVAFPVSFSVALAYLFLA
jgi:hypothetical protein